MMAGDAAGPRDGNRSKVRILSHRSRRSRLFHRWERTTGRQGLLKASWSVQQPQKRTNPMSYGFHFHLPDWPPQRLLSEAALAHNLRHLEDPLLDPETSPWPLLRRAILAFLR